MEAELRAFLRELHTEQQAKLHAQQAMTEALCTQRGGHASI